MVCSSGVDAVLIAHNFPELGTNLVTTLTTLDVQNLPHDCCLVAAVEQEGGVEGGLWGQGRRLGMEGRLLLTWKMKGRESLFWNSNEARLSRSDTSKQRVCLQNLAVVRFQI